MQRLFAKQINATTVTVNASHGSFISYPVETAQLILNATKESSIGSTIKLLENL